MPGGERHVTLGAGLALVQEGSADRWPRYPFQRGLPSVFVDSIEVSTGVRVPPEDAYEFLLDFPGYAKYSKHLQEVRLCGRGADDSGSADSGIDSADSDGGVDSDGGLDGHANATYALTFAWWKLTHTVRSQVTSVDPPNEIRWELLGALDARGRWVVEPTDEGSRVSLIVTYDADSADDGLLDLPVLVSMDWVVDRAADIAVEEGQRVVERVVEDLEGERRPVELRVEERSSA